MTLVVVQQEQEAVVVPEWVSDLSSFRRWAKSDDFPERGCYSHLDGRLWVDPSMERAGHNQVKTQVSAVLTLLTQAARNGRYFGDRMLLTNVEADLSTEPDGMFLSYDALRDERVLLEQGEDSIEVQGSPDMVLEVVSPSSRQKDTVVLRDLYWRAGITEYWLAEPRRADVTFEIHRRGAKGYSVVRKHDGWIRSTVFGKSFRLERRADQHGLPIYTLSVRQQS